MERNWLIRTKQNQILGPVAKAKVVEFYHKGALGLEDEVCSGNGYWFSFKEKDLVEKYLIGDVPQGYNPISESRSHLSKKENPDRTTSINTAPVNANEAAILVENAPIVLPNESELDYPDITLVNKVLDIPAQNMATETAGLEEVKLPDNDDLEFPDAAAITFTVSQTPIIVVKEASIPQGLKAHPAEKLSEASPIEPVGPIVYPEEDDLAYPDLSIEETPEEPPKITLDFKEKSKEIKISKQELTPQPVVSPTIHAVEEKKILHERKTKSAPRPIQKEGASASEKNLPERKVPEELKKRNDNYMMYILVMIVLIMVALFFYYYRTILNKPLPV
jgi:hypothetical protein